MPLEGLQVTALWTAINYTITFDSAGGSTVAPITQGYETAITPPAVPNKDGYTFIGWNPELPEKMPLNGLAVTAAWEIVLYNITYHLNGGTNHNDNPSTYTILTPTIEFKEATKEGHSFSGWYDAIEGGSRVYDIQQGSFGDVNLYARYTVKEYTITYYVDNVSYKEEKYDYGIPITLLAEPTKEGYTFSGWDIEEFPATMPAVNIRIDGTFTINKYEVVFKDYDETVLKTENVDYGSDAEAPANPDNKEGYHFTSWDKVFTNITANLVVTALYNPNSYTVSFDTGDADINVTYDSAYGTLPTPLKTGYSFAGWYANENLEGLITAQTVVKTTSNHQLYAKWTVNSYKVTFHYNDASSGDEVTETLVEYDSTYGDLPSPEKIGHTFIGWYKDSLEGDLITSESKVTTASAHSLYAKWEINTYIVRFKDYDGGVLKIEDVTHGSGATAPTENPERYGYIFKGWDPENLCNYGLLDIGCL